MIRIGVVGTGSIVSTFINDARRTGHYQFVAVFSRTYETGNAFADAHAIPNVYTDYTRMLSDAQIDAVYIASPNSLHYMHAKEALRAKKHVLLEKPFTGTLETAEALVLLAKLEQVILMEAICTVHMPHYKHVKKHIDRVGTLKLVQCNYSQYSSRYDALLAGETPNVFNPKFSGGALADINIYNLHFVVDLFGKPESIEYIANCHKNGIDTSGVLTLSYGSFKAVLIGAKDSFSENYAQIQGDMGYVKLLNGVNRMDAVEWVSKVSTETISKQDQPRLYYEAEVFASMIDAQDFTLRDVYLEKSLEVVRIAEEARKQIGLEFDS